MDFDLPELTAPTLSYELDESGMPVLAKSDKGEQADNTTSFHPNDMASKDHGGTELNEYSKRMLDNYIKQKLHPTIENDENLSNSLGGLGRNLVALTYGRAGLTPSPSQVNEPATKPDNALKDLDTLAQVQQRLGASDKLNDPVHQAYLASLSKLADRKAVNEARKDDPSYLPNKYRQDQLNIAGNRLKTVWARLGIANEKMENTENQGLIPYAKSQLYPLDPKSAGQLKSMAGNAVALHDMISELKNLAANNNLSRFYPGTEAARIKGLAGELPVYINAAQSNRVIAGSRAEAIAAAFDNPEKATTAITNMMSGNTEVGANLDELWHMVDTSIRAQHKAHGVDMLDDYSKPNPEPVVGSARPGRPGNSRNPYRRAIEASAAGKTKSAAPDTQNGPGVDPFKVPIGDIVTGKDGRDWVRKRDGWELAQ